MRLKDLGKQEFELDAKLKEYQQILEDHETGKRKVSIGELALAQTGIELTLPKLRRTQRQVYGWRFVEQTYSEETLGLEGYLQSKILDLEVKEVGYQKTLNEYKVQVGMLEKEIQMIANAMNPDENGLREAKEKLLACHEQYAIAEIGLPMVQAELEEARKELERVREGNKKAHSVKETYESISAEIHGRGMERVRKYGIDYSLAVSQVLREDPELAKRYVFEV